MDLRAGPLLGEAVEVVQVCHGRLPRGAPPPGGEAAEGEEGSKLRGEQSRRQALLSHRQRNHRA